MSTKSNKTEIENVEGIAKAIKNVELFKAVTIQKLFTETDDIVDMQSPIKVNLPDTHAGFDSGNGEGIWLQPLRQQDVDVYNAETAGETFLGFLLNGSIYYPPLIWGTVIKVKNMKADARPLIDKEWLDGVISDSSNGKMDLDKILK